MNLLGHELSLDQRSNLYLPGECQDLSPGESGQSEELSLSTHSVCVRACVWCVSVCVCVWCVFKQQPRSGAHDRPPLELTHSGILEPLTLPVKHTHTHVCTRAYGLIHPKVDFGESEHGRAQAQSVWD